MQTPVRFYITQSDDETVVRSIPVVTRPVVAQEITVKAVDQEVVDSTAPARKNVAERVRSVVKRDVQPS